MMVNNAPPPPDNNPPPPAVPPSLCSKVASSVWEHSEKLHHLFPIFAAIFFAVVAVIFGASLLWSFADPNPVLTSFKTGKWNYVATPSYPWVERPDVLLDLQTDILRPLVANKYIVLVGQAGSGKSTLVNRAAREVPSHFNGTNGVVYFRVPSYRDLEFKFITQLADLVGFSFVKSSPLDVFASYFGFKIQQPPDSPSLWDPLSDALRAAATKFKEEHGRPATLVIDDAQELHKKDVLLLDELQSFAKEVADLHILRVVFVSSEFSVYTHMYKQSPKSRSKAVEMMSMSTEGAINYLVSMFPFPNAVAAFIVQNITGTNFVALQEVEPRLSTMEEAQDELHNRTRTINGKIISLGLDSAKFKSIFCLFANAPGHTVWKDSFINPDHFNQDRIDDLVKNEIFLPHLPDTYSLYSPVVVAIFKQLCAASG
eukprot:GDKI01033769.1.p1 GENE.GDKI01033769.1~~GDKI01033769.1.p1  ORF type:complete len:428 (-),score=75.60 GDKI01033769.1:458-1741(-)